MSLFHILPLSYRLFSLSHWLRFFLSFPFLNHLFLSPSLFVFTFSSLFISLCIFFPPFLSLFFLSLFLFLPLSKLCYFHCCTAGIAIPQSNIQPTIVICYYQCAVFFKSNKESSHSLTVEHVKIFIIFFLSQQSNSLILIPSLLTQSPFYVS